MEYYSTIERNGIGSFVETLMDLETVIHSEASQKKKKKYYILINCTNIVYVWNLKINHIDDLIPKAKIETQLKRTNICISRGKAGLDESEDLDSHTYTIVTMFKKKKR